jgi:hypothetical protein
VEEEEACWLSDGAMVKWKGRAFRAWNPVGARVSGNAMGVGFVGGSLGPGRSLDTPRCTIE